MTALLGSSRRFRLLVLVVLPVLVGPLTGCGTTYLRQGANQFNSNTYVGWVAPEQGHAANLTGPEAWVRVQSVRGRSADAKHVVKENDCFAVDYASGFLHHSFEGSIEQAWAKVSWSRVRSELSMVLKAEQRIPKSRRSNSKVLTEEGTLVFSNTGQLTSRHITGNGYESIYGPARYRGGELQLTVSVAEQDKDEYNAMVADSVEFAERTGKPAEKTRGKAGQSIDILRLRDLSASTPAVAQLIVSPLGYVAIAAEAAKAGAYLLQAINQEDDNLMKESITFVNAADLPEGDGRTRPLSPLLRYGTYVFARASVKVDVNSDACIIYSHGYRTAKAQFFSCPSSFYGEEWKAWQNVDERDAWQEVTALVVNLRPARDDMCLASSEQPVQGGATGVVAPTSSKASGG